MFFCPLCGIGFYRVHPYYRHMRNIHNIQKDEAREIRIRNPDIVNMRNINTDTEKKEEVKKFYVKKSFSPNASEFIAENDDQSKVYTGTKDVCDSNSVSEQSADMDTVYAGTPSDLTGTIVETVVTIIESNTFVEPTPGYVVVDEDGLKCLQ